MNIAELESFLHAALFDRTITGSEREALAAWLALHVKSDHDRGVVRHTVFDVARRAVADPDSHQLIDCLETLLKVIVPIQPGATVERRATSGAERVYFAPGEACLSQIISRFHYARKSADVCVYTITDNRISRAILEAHQRGVKVRIITDSDKMSDAGSDIREFEAAGIPVKFDDVHRYHATSHNGHMHHKFALFDGVHLLNGSYNWTRGAAEINYENLVDTDDPTLVAAFTTEFSRLWNKF